MADTIIAVKEGAERASGEPGAEPAAAADAPPAAPPAPGTAEEVLAMMRRTMGAVPPAIEKSVAVDPGLILEHARSRGFAMPAQAPALDDATRTLVYLAAALAGSSPACVRAMANKVVQQGIPRAAVTETLHIVRFAMATRVIGDAEPVFDALLRGAP